MTRALLVAVLAVSCGPSGVGGACLDAGDCTGVAICNANQQCQEVECTSSAVCDLGQHCDTTAYECVSGCAEDNDCLAGESCRQGSCQPYGCRDTELDCHYGEVCNAQTHACELTTQPHCRRADTFGDQVACDSVGGTVACYNDTGECYCMLSCTSQSSCPRGLTCIDAWGTGSNVCYGDCRYLIEQL